MGTFNLIDDIMTSFLECICDDYCKCESCKVDDADCPLENDLKNILKNQLKEYLA